jgi:hypothetical protein
VRIAAVGQSEIGGEAREGHRDHGGRRETGNGELPNRGVPKPQIPLTAVSARSPIGRRSVSVERLVASSLTL